MAFLFDWGFLLFILLAAGFAAGVLAGLLGVGGGIIMVPVLFQVFIFLEIDTMVQIHCAVATSLAVICLTALQSLRSHSRRGVVDFALLRFWAPSVILGALGGAVAARFITAGGLILLFATMSGILGLRMLIMGNARDVVPRPMNRWLQIVLTWLIGFFSALMGIGGGTFSVPLVRRLGRSIHQAVAVSSGIGFFVAVPGAIGFIWSGWGLNNLPPVSLGYVNILAFAAMLPMTLLGAPVGVRLAHALSRRVLQYVFAGFLLASALRMVYALDVSSF